MADDRDDWPSGGRTLRWRAGMLTAGLGLGAYAVLLVVRPELLAWTVAAAVAGLAVVCLASALFARSRRD